MSKSARSRRPNQRAPPRRGTSIEARIPAAVTIDRIGVEDLPSDWRDLALREKRQAIGTQWVRKQSAAVLAVPSAVIAAETNYLLNPLHPEFRRIEIGKPRKFETDLRLIRT
ncbi:MAG: hypothetical protein A3H35_11975 [Betaproteobacteria bacterium RIFCSPLOWO2_02_FULL_62_17]|nr:MAG: hypothetical protein A3H35_11975 [Betaproteobacteria bacterium RIFCSPLOWO2_02_FULL_62_17]